MALKGVKEFTNTFDKNFKLFLEWEVVKQDLYNLKNTIKWSVYAQNTARGTSGFYMTKQSYYYDGDRIYFPAQEYNIPDNGERVNIVTDFHTTVSTNSISLKVYFVCAIKIGNTVVDTNNRWECSVGAAEVGVMESTLLVRTANNFNDEENTTITYEFTNSDAKGRDKYPSQITKAEACISFTGGNDDIPYREITKPGKYTAWDQFSYTFEFTEEERQTLRKNFTSSFPKVVRIYIRSTFEDGVRRFNYADVTVSLVNHTPTLAPVVRDVNPLTLAVTGDETKVIKGRSNVYFETGAAARKEAVIASQLVTNGTNAVKNQPNGIIEAIESNVFVFNATDSRGVNAETATLELEALPYIPLTCHQKIDMELISGTDTAARVTISGNYFNGSFGAVQNELKLEIRRSGDDIRGLTEWVDVTPLLPDISDNTYTLSFNVEGLNGGTAYDFQCRATDKLGTVETPVYTARLTPIFDWSETDFNFNVPVNINGDLSISGSFTTGDGSSFLLPYILSDTTTDGNIELNDNVSNYEYIEIFYIDNNGKSGGYTRFIPPAPGTTLELSLSLIQAANDSTYIRRTGYKCKDNKLEVNAAFTGYCWIRNAEITHATDKNYLKVVRVVGYK